LFAAPLFSRFTHPPLPSVRKDKHLAGRGWSQIIWPQRGTIVIVNVRKCAKTVHTIRVNSTLVQYSNGAAHMAAPL